MTPIDPRVLRYAPETSTLMTLIASAEATIAALDVIHPNDDFDELMSDEARLAGRVRATSLRDLSVARHYLSHVVDTVIRPPPDPPEIDIF